MLSQVESLLCLGDGVPRRNPSGNQNPTLRPKQGRVPHPTDTIMPNIGTRIEIFGPATGNGDSFSAAPLTTTFSILPEDCQADSENSGTLRSQKRRDTLRPSLSMPSGSRLKSGKGGAVRKLTNSRRWRVQKNLTFPFDSNLTPLVRNCDLFARRSRPNVVPGSPAQTCKNGFSPLIPKSKRGRMPKSAMKTPSRGRN
jgi:hypothetical protein